MSVAGRDAERVAARRESICSKYGTQSLVELENNHMSSAKVGRSTAVKTTDIFTPEIHLPEQRKALGIPKIIKMPPPVVTNLILTLAPTTY